MLFQELSGNIISVLGGYLYLLYVCFLYAMARALSAVAIDVVKRKLVNGIFVSESPLFECDNVVYTPHQSGNSSEANARSHIKWVENVCRVLNGEEPRYLVNEVWPSNAE